jgi:chemotaxis signal transduction protein
VKDSNVLRVIIKLGDKLFSVKADQVLSMEALRDVKKIPYVPNHMRGVVELRGQVIPLVDLRVLLDLGSYLDELKDLLCHIEKGEADFKMLLSETEKAISESDSNDFCKVNMQGFISWLENFQTENIFISDVLGALYRNIQHICKLLSEVRNYIQKSESDIALQLLSQIKEDELDRLTESFALAKDVVSNKNNELFIVVQAGSNKFAVTVDHIIAVDIIKNVEDTEDSFFEFLNQDLKGLIESLGRNKRFDELIISLNLEKLYGYLNLGDIKK